MLTTRIVTKSAVRSVFFDSEKLSPFFAVISSVNVSVNLSVNLSVNRLVKTLAALCVVAVCQSICLPAANAQPNGTDTRSPESVAATLERLSGGLMGGGSNAASSEPDEVAPNTIETSPDEILTDNTQTSERSNTANVAEIPSAEVESPSGEIKEALVVGSDTPVDAMSPPEPDVAAHSAATSLRASSFPADSAKGTTGRNDPSEQLTIASNYDKARAAANSGNFTQARKIWEILADLDHADSQYALGRMYARGDGVKQNFATARSYFERAAAHNHGRALYSLGIMARNGDGQLINQEKALSYFERAAKAGNDDARTEIKKLRR